MLYWGCACMSLFSTTSLCMCPPLLFEVAYLYHSARMSTKTHEPSHFCCKVSALPGALMFDALEDVMARSGILAPFVNGMAKVR